MVNLIKKLTFVLGTGLVLLNSRASRALGLMRNDLDPTLNAAELGRQKIAGIITGIETWHNLLIIDQGRGNVTRVIVDANTRIARDGFPVDFRDLVAGNNVTIEQPASK